jgi:large subunit ribosomal protein L18
MAGTTQKVLARQRRKKRVRKRVFGTSERPRLSVFKSAKHIYAQVIDDVQGQTLVSASTLDPEIRESIKYGGNIEAAKKVGALVGKRALEKGIKTVVFDRNGFLYHGRIKALADSAREAGLKF